MLNLEISDNFKQLKLITSSIYYLTRTIEKNFPHYICSLKFFNTQYRSLSNLFVKEQNRMMKKLTWNLLNNYFNEHYKKILNVNNAKNIKHVCFNSSSKSRVVLQTNISD